MSFGPNVCSGSERHWENIIAGHFKLICWVVFEGSLGADNSNSWFSFRLCTCVGKNVSLSFPSPSTGYVHSSWYIIHLCSSLPSITNRDPAASTHPPAAFTPSPFFAITAAPHSASEPEPGRTPPAMHAESAHPPTLKHLGAGAGVRTVWGAHGYPLHPNAQVSTVAAAALRYHRVVSRACSPAGQGLQ